MINNTMDFKNSSTAMSKNKINMNLLVLTITMTTFMAIKILKFRTSTKVTNILTIKKLDSTVIHLKSTKSSQHVQVAVNEDSILVYLVGRISMMKKSINRMMTFK